MSVGNPAMNAALPYRSWSWGANSSPNGPAVLARAPSKPFGSNIRTPKLWTLGLRGNITPSIPAAMNAFFSSVANHHDSSIRFERDVDG